MAVRKGAIVWYHGSQYNAHGMYSVFAVVKDQSGTATEGMTRYVLLRLQRINTAYPHLRAKDLYNVRRDSFTVLKKGKKA